jgi:integrase
LNINQDLSLYARAPRTFGDLVDHFKSVELVEGNENLAFSSQYGYRCYLDNWIVPKWGGLLVSELEDLPGVYIESWLKTIPKARGTKAKIRNILSAVCSHALRYGWMKIHPIQRKVRQSAKPEREQVPLEVEELQAFFKQLDLELRVLILLDVPNGLRCGELFALQWNDFNLAKKTVFIRKSIWKQHVGPVKTKESERVMPLDDAMVADLLAWRRETPYAQGEDWVFALRRKRGKQPLWPEAVLRNHLRPAAIKAGITKHISWHTFRHTFSTLLAQNGEDVKTVQSLMRHANPRLTLEVYTHAVDSKKRAAQSKVVEMILPRSAVEVGREVRI